eukprot:CAMPEP_0204616874 /NCGR_PEP_ID=MMETSP0717-20131115/4013_1 /ASSEMBLY_ACC=CAM_ASM_000666 /TAXON_ID=230516 /ORGANISM="Chaetoceros curvisetus" /LENGTH=67 /DNA_ID=CAMNT_0051630249 /DNA_START=466 /DNA_END=666 /DNA_ORIENTATION=+
MTCIPNAAAERMMDPRLAVSSILSNANIRIGDVDDDDVCSDFRLTYLFNHSSSYAVGTFPHAMAPLA